MSNSTTSLPEIKEDSSLFVHRLQSIIFSGIWTIVLAYVVIILSCSAWKKQRKRSIAERRKTVHREERSGSGRADSGNYRVRPASKVVEILTILVTCSSLIFMAIELPLVKPPTDLYCNVYHRTSTIMSIITLSTIYFALWFRIYSVFYHHPLIKRRSSKKIQILSKATCVLLMLMLLANAASFLIAHPYIASANACQKVPSREHTTIKWIALVVTAVSFQATLLGLFIYPLNMHRRNMLQIGFDAGTVMPVIKRAFVTTIICVFSDTSNAVFAILNRDNFNYIRHTAYGCNIIINLFALILSGADWKERLLPFLSDKSIKSKKKKRVISVYHVSTIESEIRE